MGKQLLIEKYERKVRECNEAIQKINDMIVMAENDSTIDVEDLEAERENASTDRRIYAKFVKELKKLK